jgi:hypothetical protein
MMAFDGGALGFRNRLINADMRIDQRNSGNALNITASNQYLVDRWAVSAGSAVSGTLTAQRVATSAPGGAQFAVRLARTAGTYVGSLVLVQVIESTNCYDLAGKTVTVSFRARKGSSYTASLTASVVTGTGSDEGVNGTTGSSWTGYAAPASLAPSLTTSFQTFSFQATLGASVQEVAVHFSTGNFSGSGSANDYVDITDVQLEIGVAATPFERRPFTLERALCQRYYQVFSNVTIEGYAAAGNQRAVQTPVPFPVAMRITPVRTTLTNGTYTNVRSSSNVYAGLIPKNSQSATALVEATAAGYTQCVDQVEAFAAEL